jgi:hypothetical protein
MDHLKQSELQTLRVVFIPPSRGSPLPATAMLSIAPETQISRAHGTGYSGDRRTHYSVAEVFFQIAGHFQQSIGTRNCPFWPLSKRRGVCKMRFTAVSHLYCSVPGPLWVLKSLLSLMQDTDQSRKSEVTLVVGQ